MMMHSIYRARRRSGHSPRCIALLGILVLGVVLSGTALAQSTVDGNKPYAWGEAIGWVNAAPGDDGMLLYKNYATGFLWSESCGWINLGDGSPDSGDSYANDSAEDFGVNNDGTGKLSGLAWGEAIGWINFDTLASGGSQVVVGEDGQISGLAWSESVGWINLDSGYGVALVLDSIEGEGGGEGEGEDVGEGEGEGVGEGEGEGVGEGEGEGLTEGIFVVEGEGEPIPSVQSSDQNGDGVVEFNELLRVIQLFNANGYHCADVPAETEDGYVAGPGANQGCRPYTNDYNPQDWQISLSELLRGLQFYNSEAYFYCPEAQTEDGYCPGFG